MRVCSRVHKEIYRLGSIACIHVVLPARATLRVSSALFPSAKQTGVCAHAASVLTSANAEFVRQALISPENVAAVLETLYRGGGGDGNEGDTAKGRIRMAASCRLNGARVLRAIVSDADASDMTR